MSLPNTDNLDIPAQGLPVNYTYSLTSNAPVIDTTTLDIPVQGLPAIFLYTITSGGAQYYSSLATLGIG